VQRAYGPIVVFDQLYSFDVDSLIQGIPRPEDTPEDQEKRFRAAAEELYYTIVQVADNAGATDEHRALNYLTVRFDRIYAKTAEMYEQNASLSRVEVRPSRLSSTRSIVDVIFMNLPGFTAEVSLYEESLHYRMAGAHTHANGTIQPASSMRWQSLPDCYSDCLDWCYPYDVGSRRPGASPWHPPNCICR
jgi:hypothetical protein